MTHSDRIRAQFDRRAANYGSRTAWIGDSELAAAVERTLISTHDQSVCLDVGTGTGALATSVSVRGRWIGIDPSSEMLRAADLEHRAAGMAEALPIRSGTVDVVASRSVLYYTDIPQAFREAYRVLRSGGQYVCVEKVADRFTGAACDWLRRLEAARNPLKRQLLTADELESMARRAGFHTASRLKLQRSYNQPLDAWLKAIPGEERQRTVLRLVDCAPAEVADVGFRASNGRLSIPITWLVMGLAK